MELINEWQFTKSMRTVRSCIMKKTSLVIFIVIVHFLNIVNVTTTNTANNNFDPFMDSKLFDINWYGPIQLNQEEIDSLGDRHMMITTNKKEKYRCILPEQDGTKEDDVLSYSGPSADQLMQELFTQTFCSYRIESYWTYELCHGKHLKQYHETKDQGTPPKTQEYYLGFGNNKKEAASGANSAAIGDPDLGQGSKPVPVREVDGISLPFYEVVMDDGTKCDLTGRPRRSRVLYMCQPDGRGEVYELKESSTCEYEVFVLTSVLCRHPKYRPKSQPINQIRCHAMLGSPTKPSTLSSIEYELLSLREEYQQANRQENRYIHKQKQDPVISGNKKSEETLKVDEKQHELGAMTDRQTVRNVLSGSQCVTGGSGWWRHEVCVGRSIRQFHTEKGKEITIYLGHWDKDKHLQWLQENPTKRPRPSESRKHISMHYSNGDICDLTGSPRTCELKLKCLQPAQNPHAIIISMSEPNVCQYVVTMESALFCSVLSKADEDGILDLTQL